MRAVAKTGVGPQTAAEGSAVLAGHVGVEQDQVGADGAGEGQHEVTDGGVDLITLQFEEVTQERHDVRVVVHDEDASPGCHLCVSSLYLVRVTPGRRADARGPPTQD